MGYLIIFGIVLWFFIIDWNKKFEVFSFGDKMFIGFISLAISIFVNLLLIMILSATCIKHREVKIPVEEISAVGTSIIVKSKNLDEPMIIKTGSSKLNLDENNYLKYNIAYGEDNIWTTLFLMNDEHKIKNLSDKEIMKDKSPSEIGINKKDIK